MDSFDRLSVPGNVLDEQKKLKRQVRRIQGQNFKTFSLSDISVNLGAIRSGMFICGLGDPLGVGDPFSGIVICYPARTIGSDSYNLYGMSAGTFEFGISATTGKGVFAAGAAILDASGIILRAETYPATTYMQWKAQDTSALVGFMTLAYGGAAVHTGLIITARAHDSGVRGYVQLAAEDDGGNKKAFLNVDQNGSATFDFQSVNGAVGTSSLLVKTKTTGTNAPNIVMYLDTATTGTPAAGLGTAISFRAQNSAGTMTTMGYIGLQYTDVTNASEDGRIVIGRMVNGSLENGALDWGTYTPTLTNGTNVAASTAFATQWMRVGNVATVAGFFNVDPTATGDTILDISTPVNYTFTAQNQAGGTAAAFVVQESATIIAISDNTVRVRWTAVSIVNHTMTFSFTYKIA